MVKILLSAFMVMVIVMGCSTSPTNDRGIVLGDTLTTESGLKYVYRKIGSGRQVETGSKVWTYLALSVNNKEVWNTNEMADSSFIFVANKDRMIKGFTEVTMKLREGDEIAAVLPPQLAYGAQGSGEAVPPNATLVYTTYIMKKVSEPKQSLSDTLFAAYQTGGHQKMIATRERILNSPDTAHYYYDPGQYRLLWNLLNDANMHQENLQMIAFINTTKDSGMRWYRVRTYEKMGNFKQALDSLNTLMASDPTMGLNERAVQLRAELSEKVK